MSVWLLTSLAGRHRYQNVCEWCGTVWPTHKSEISALRDEVACHETHPPGTKVKRNKNKKKRVQNRRRLR